MLDLFSFPITSVRRIKPCGFLSLVGVCPGSGRICRKCEVDSNLSKNNTRVRDMNKTEKVYLPDELREE